jgi:hypothetical protein
MATWVQIVGSGFQVGATVTMDGGATNIAVLNATRISAQTPIHAAGRVDVVVTNPDGQSAHAPGGFVYEAVTLTVSETTVAPGAQLQVSWVAPRRSNPAIDGDWIGLFRIGEANRQRIWERYTTGVSGTFTLDAPLAAGEYEFRYLVDDDFVDVARSKPVTVTAEPAVNRLDL